MAYAVGIRDWSSDVCAADLTGIALSIVVIGGALALGLSLPAIAAMALVGAFAVFHGHAHGAEMPVAASGLAYGLGFLLATALLHGAGLALGFGLDKAAGAASHKLARAGGAFIGLSGLAILARSEEHTSNSSH